MKIGDDVLWRVEMERGDKKGVCDWQRWKVMVTDRDTITGLAAVTLDFFFTVFSM